MPALRCGAAQIAQRTIDDARVLGDAAKAQDIELIIDESDDDLKDTDQGGATIELNSFFDLDAYRKDQPPSGEHSLELVEDSDGFNGTRTFAAQDADGCRPCGYDDGVSVAFSADSDGRTTSGDN